MMCDRKTSGMESLVGSDGCPYLSSQLDAIDPEDLRGLVTMVLRHWEHAGAATCSQEQMERSAWACCATLVIGPATLDTPVDASPLRERTREVLSDSDAPDLPEARACALWLSAAENIGSADTADGFTSLLSEPLWPPVFRLVCRALSYFGRRNAVAGSLPAEGPLSPFHVDPWIEASHAASVPADWTERIVTDPVGGMSAETAGHWKTLAEMETMLACGAAGGTIQQSLAKLIALAVNETPRTLDAADRRTIAGRACAAAVRLGLALGRGDSGAFASPAAENLPSWERSYIRGLLLWSAGDLAHARHELERALNSNPRQNSIRLGLAALLTAGSPPKESLDLLDAVEPTVETLQARAALQARMERCDEATATLRSIDEDHVAVEPLRFTWRRARQQMDYRRAALETALAERRGEWRIAESAWQRACTICKKTMLDTTRQLLAATQQLQSKTAPPQGYHAERLDRRMRRLWHEVGILPLVGTETFFRGVAAMSEDPALAARDFKALLNRRGWIDAERRAGGARLVVVGDALARLGLFREAAQAYRLAVTGGREDMASRMALVDACLPPGTDSASETTAAGAASPEPATGDPDDRLLAAVAALVNGDTQTARSQVERSAGSGSEDALRRCIAALCDTVEGSHTTLPDDELAVAGMSKRSRSILRLLLGPDEMGEKIAAFAAANGRDWASVCPIQPQQAVGAQASKLCHDGKWDEALKLAEGFSASGQTWANDLAIRIRVGRALRQALDGALDMAESELTAMEKAIRKGRQNT